LVHIKKITIKGFKTFGKKTTISLEKGLTIVTGPNGSGKSNVMDSIKFALGELSPRELRGAAISDVIHKNPSKSSAGSAYVSLQFENADRGIPVDSDLVTISREYSGGGEGVYRLNGRRISRKYLMDLLSSANIMATGHNMVPQHSVTRIAELSPEERMKVIEDIVGIGIYDEKKREAEAHLQRAEINIRIASAKVAEVRQRVESLERERNDYIRHSFIKNEVSKLKALLASSEMKRLDDEIRPLRSKSIELSRRLNELEAGRGELLSKRSEIERKKRALDGLSENGNESLFQLEREISDLNNSISALLAEIGVKASMIRGMEDEIKSLESRWSSIKDFIEKLAGDYRSALAKRRGLESRIESLRSELSIADEGLRGIEAEIEEREGILKGLEREMDSLKVELANLDSRIEGARRELDSIEKRISSLNGKRGDLESTRVSLSANRQRISDLMGRIGLEIEEIGEESIRIGRGIEEREAEIERAERIFEEASVALAGLNARVQREIGPAAILGIEELARLGAIDGFLGRLSDLIEYSDEHGKAIEAASDGWLDALVVRDLRTAVACIERLRRHGVRGIRLIPLENLARVENASPRVPGMVGALSELIKCDDALRPAVDFVFGDTVLVNSKMAAAYCYLKGLRAVTESGNLYEPGGGLSSGFHGGPDRGSMAEVRRMERGLRDRLERLKGFIEKRDEERGALARAMREISEQRSKMEASLRFSKKELEGIDANIGRIESALKAISEEVEDLAVAKADLETGLEALSKRRIDVAGEIERIEEEVRKIDCEGRYKIRLELRSKRDAISKELEGLRGEYVGIEGEIADLKYSIKSNAKELKGISQRIAALKGEISNMASGIEESEGRKRSFEARLAGLKSKRAELVESLKSVASERRALESELEGLEKEISEATRSIEEIGRAFRDLDRTIQEKENRMELLRIRLRDLGFESPIATTEFDAQAIEGEIESLESELGRIGLVNQLAIVHYEDQKGKYKQLSIRIGELEMERSSILNFMAELEEKKLNAFLSAFENISQNFGDIFKRMTGGEGKLTLENPENPFDGGVDISAKFPGKAELSIGSASGGEKSVATVCFILALQAFRPVPFYAFDEIDAHLDPLNSQKLAEILRERSKDSQFIVITLKDATISAGDKVYGVYLKDGLSNVVCLPKIEGGGD
jgi:chromosome segregation protein